MPEDMLYSLGDRGGEHRMDKTHLSIRMDDRLHDKFRYVAGAEGRSMNSQVLYLIRRCIRDYELKNGEIKCEQ